MIPQGIVDYLDRHEVPYDRLLHRRAVAAQEVAAALHVPGRRVVKSVLVKAGDQVWIAVLPATEIVDENQLAAVLDTPGARLLREHEFEGFFPDCEPGAEPPFGGLYGLPVVVDASLISADRVVVRAGSHEEALALRLDDFLRLENGPQVGAISRRRPVLPPLWKDWNEPAVP